MRTIWLVLALPGCFLFGDVAVVPRFDTAGIDTAERFDTAEFRRQGCFVATPTAIRLVDVEVATVTVSVPEPCRGMGGRELVGAALDDPDDAFTVEGLLPGLVEDGQPRTFTVRRTATAPGRYEGQLIVQGDGEPATDQTLQLFAEVAEER